MVVSLPVRTVRAQLKVQFSFEKSRKLVVVSTEAEGIGEVSREDLVRAMVNCRVRGLETALVVMALEAITGEDSRLRRLSASCMNCRVYGLAIAL
jgi:hypothetical protein